MRTYTVHHRLSDPGDLTREVEDLVFVKEGFCWPALFIPVVWLLFRGMWQVLLAYLAVMAAITLGSGYVGLSGNASTALGIAANLVMGLEGNDLRRWTLGRRGLRMIAIVSGRRIADAERRFLGSLVDGTYVRLPAMPARAARPGTPTATWAHPEPEDDGIGLFPGSGSAR